MALTQQDVTSRAPRSHFQRRGGVGRLGLLAGVSLIATCASLTTPTTVSACTVVGGTTVSSNSTCLDWQGTGGTIAVNSSGSVASGTITSGTLTNFPAINSSVVSGTFVNSGTISANGTITSGTGQAVAGVLVGSGSISLLTNAATGAIGATGSLDAGSVLNVIAGIANMGGSVGTISNSGTITGSGQITNNSSTPKINGIFNAGSIGAIQNLAGGEISASSSFSSANIALFNDTTGTISLIDNAVGATIVGGRTGIYTRGTIGSLLNNGYIGSLQNSAIWVQSGSIGSLTNNGTIYSTNTAISVWSGQSISPSIQSLVNTGYIHGGSGLLNGGSIGTLHNSGSIEGSWAGIGVGANLSQGVLGTITALTNDATGQITASTGTAIYVNGGASIGSLSNSGLIQGATRGIDNAGAIGTLTNQGIIDGDDAGIVVRVGNTIYPGTITLVDNRSGGDISGDDIGIRIDAGARIGSLLNAGSISGGDYAVMVAGTLGTLNNSGSLDVSELAGLGVSGSLGTFINSANLDLSSGVDGVRVLAGGVISDFQNVAGGIIYATEGNAVSVAAGGSIGTLTNSGELLGYVTAVDNAGSISRLANEAGATIGGDSFYGVTISVLNTGTIDTIVNAGLIFGNEGIQTSGLITLLDNQGTIEGRSALYGVNVDGGRISTLLNRAGGLINSTEGIGLRVGEGATIGTLTNQGMISGEDYGIFSPGVVENLSNAATGTIQAGEVAMLVPNDGSIAAISNAGLIRGVNSSGAAINASGRIGSLTNSGTIQGPAKGVLISGSGGEITNLVNEAGGTIQQTGPSGTALTVASASTLGTLTNSGLITGANGLALQGTIGSIVNRSTGTIQGTAEAISFGGAVQFGGTLVNEGLIAGSVFNYSSTNLTITGGSGSTFGTLTGASGGLGLADKGTISAASAGLTFGSGNLLLNDDMDFAGQTVSNAGATVRLANNVTLTGLYGQTAGVLNLNGHTLSVSDDVSFSGGTIQSGLLSATGTIAQSGGVLNASASANSYVFSGGTVASGNTITGASTLLFQSDGTIGAVLAGGSLTKSGLGTTVLTASNTYTGFTTVSAGILAITNSNALGATSLGTTLSPTATLRLGGGIAVGAEALQLSGNGAATAQGALESSGNNSWAGEVTFVGPSRIAVNNGTLTITGEMQESDLVSSFDLVGNGTMVVAGANNPLSGANTVSGATLLLNGTLGAPGGSLTVGSGGTLGGGGHFLGDTTINDGTLAPGNSPGTLTLGSLTLASTSTLAVELGQANVPGGSYNDLVVVEGNLTLDGTLNVSVSSGGDFGAGIYRLFNYGGTLNNQGLAFGTMPAGSSYLVQTSVANQVNLVNLGSNPLTYWDGTGPFNNGVVNGGNGTWNLASTGNGSESWTNVDGTINNQFALNAFAVFTGAPGTVTVSNAEGTVVASGMQFAVDGYVLTGQPLTLDSTTGPAVIRVGDGTTTGAGYAVTVETVLAGSSGIEKTDLGTLILTAANTYTGGTTITGGTLQLGDGTTNGSILGNVSVGQSGVLAFDVGPDVTFAQTISGAGAVSKLGAGTLSLTGPNTYSGGTTIAQGTLQVASASPLGTGGLTVGGGGTLHATGSFTLASAVTLGIGVQAPANAGTFNVDGAQTLTLAGALGGSGGLTKTGAGTLIITGTGTYGGLTTISQGTLQLGDGGTTGSISGDVLNNASLIFNRSNTYLFTGAITGSGDVTFMGGGTVLFSSPYTGPITINDSTVRLQNGSATTSPFTVNAGGILGGSATIGAVTVNSGGTVAPGYSPGTLTVGGPVTFNSGSVYLVDVTPTLEHDLILASGLVTLSTGAVVQVAAEPGRYPANARVPIITTTDTVTGTFGGVTTDYAFLQPSLTYDAQNVYLTLIYNEVAFATYAQTPNQVNTAVGAQALGFGNAVFDALLDQTAAGVPGALNQLSGEIYPSVNTVILQEAVYLREAVTARLRQSQAGLGPLSSAAQAGPATAALGQGLTPTLWAQGFGGWGNAFGNGNAASISSSVGGFFAGLDVGVADNVRAGIVAGFSQTQFDVDARNSSGSMDNYDIGLYAGGQFGALALRGGLSYTWHDVSVGRAVLFPGFSGATDGGYTVGTTQVFGEVAYDLAVGAYAFEPFLGVAYLNVSGGSLSEGGISANGAALSVNLEAQNTVYTTLGVRAATSFMVNGRALTPSLTLGWQHAFGDTTPTATMLFQGGAMPFNVQGVPIAEDTAVFGAGLAYALSDLATLQVNYTGQIASEASQNAFTAQFSLKF